MNFLADPSGFIRLKWEVLLKRNEPPIVVIIRDDKIIRTDASFTGEHGDHIIPGRRYRYQFSVRDEKEREFGKPLWLEVKIPLKAAWDLEGEVDADEQQRKMREQFKAQFKGITMFQQLMAAAEKEMEARKYPEDMREWVRRGLRLSGTGCGGNKKGALLAPHFCYASPNRNS